MSTSEWICPRLQNVLEQDKTEDSGSVLGKVRVPALPSGHLAPPCKVGLAVACVAHGHRCPVSRETAIPYTQLEPPYGGCHAYSDLALDDIFAITSKLYFLNLKIVILIMKENKFESVNFKIYIR